MVYIYFRYALNFYNILNDGTSEVLDMQQWVETTLEKARTDGVKVSYIIFYILFI